MPRSRREFDLKGFGQERGVDIRLGRRKVAEPEMRHRPAIKRGGGIVAFLNRLGARIQPHLVHLRPDRRLPAQRVEQFPSVGRWAIMPSSRSSPSSAAPCQRERRCHHGHAFGAFLGQRLEVFCQRQPFLGAAEQCEQFDLFAISEPSGCSASASTRSASAPDISPNSRRRVARA